MLLSGVALPAGKESGGASSIMVTSGAGLSGSLMVSDCVGSVRTCSGMQFLVVGLSVVASCHDGSPRQQVSQADFCRDARATAAGSVVDRRRGAERVLTPVHALRLGRRVDERGSNITEPAASVEGVSTATPGQHAPRSPLSPSRQRAQAAKTSMSPLSPRAAAAWGEGRGAAAWTSSPRRRAAAAGDPPTPSCRAAAVGARKEDVAESPRSARARARASASRRDGGAAGELVPALCSSSGADSSSGDSSSSTSLSESAACEQYYSGGSDSGAPSLTSGSSKSSEGSTRGAVDGAVDVVWDFGALFTWLET